MSPGGDFRESAYLKYIRGQKKKLYLIAVKELAQQEGTTEALVLLAAYGK